MYSPRHEQIVALLQSLRSVSVAELAARLSVSEVTIRKDLTILEERGVVLRSHGGAMLAQSANPMKPVAARTGEQHVQKEAVARLAARLISEGEIVALDAGSTTLALAGAISRRAIRVVTNSLPIAEELSHGTDTTLTLIGGNYRVEAGSFIGPIAESAIESIRVDIAFIGATAFDEHGRCYSHNEIEGQTKRRFLAAARRRFVIVDANKFRARGFAQFAGPKEIDGILCDDFRPGMEQLQAHGIELMIAAGEPAQGATG